MIEIIQYVDQDNKAQKCGSPAVGTRVDYWALIAE